MCKVSFSLYETLVLTMSDWGGEILIEYQSFYL